MKLQARALLAVTRRLASPLIVTASVRVVLLVFFVAVAVYYLLDRQQSFTIVAASQTVSVNLTANKQTVWVLGGVILCRRRQAGEVATQEDTPRKICDKDIYTEHFADTADIVWPRGFRLTVSGYDSTRLSVQVARQRDDAKAFLGQVEITDRSILFFDRTTLGQLGGLAASGKIEIGQIAESGSAKLTRGGSFEIRENLRLTSGTSVVLSGAILPGDFVRLTDRDGNGVDAAMILIQSAVPLADFEIVLTSPAQKSAIEITRVGNARATITTRWTDRLSNDPLPLAVSILLGLFGASLGIVRSLIGNAANRPKK